MTDQYLAAGFGRLVDPQVHADLLRSTVRLARVVFGAAAASIFLYDPDRDALVFEAASGHGEDQVVGADPAVREPPRAGELREAQIVGREEIRIAVAQPVGEALTQEGLQCLEQGTSEARALDPIRKCSR